MQTSSKLQKPQSELSRKMQTVPGISLTSIRMVSTRPLCQGARRNTDKNTQHICRQSQQGQIRRNQQWQFRRAQKFRWRQTTDTFSRQIQLWKKLLQDLNRQQPMDSCLRKNWKNFWIISRTMPKMKSFLRHLPKMNIQQILCQPFRTG